MVSSGGLPLVFVAVAGVGGLLVATVVGLLIWHHRRRTKLRRKQILPGRSFRSAAFTPDESAAVMNVLRNAYTENTLASRPSAPSVSESSERPLSVRAKRRSIVGSSPLLQTAKEVEMHSPGAGGFYLNPLATSNVPEPPPHTTIAVAMPPPPPGMDRIGQLQQYSRSTSSMTKASITGSVLRGKAAGKGKRGGRATTRSAADAPDDDDGDFQRNPSGRIDRTEFNPSVSRNSVI